MGILEQEYFAAQNRPAPTTYDYRLDSSLNDDFLRDADGTNVLVLAFCVRNVLTDSECDELIGLAEDHGIDLPNPSAGSLRTAKRTTKYENKDLSTRIAARLTEQLSAKLPPSDNLGEFHGIHSNWRIVRYDEGDSFGAHQDQMDSLQLKKPDGSKELVVSSHTLLINLSPDGVDGGATRFYPNCKVKGTQEGQYQNAVDVFLPRGWAIAFRQKGLIHAGQPVFGETPKYVAQAGVLRRPAADTFIQPSVFRLGPGLDEAVARMAAKAN